MRNNPLKKKMCFESRYHPARLEVVLYNGVKKEIERFVWITKYSTHPLWIILKENLIHDLNNKPTKH